MLAGMLFADAPGDAVADRSLLFTHIPRTGGSALNAVFEPWYGGRTVYSHDRDGLSGHEGTCVDAPGVPWMLSGHFSMGRLRDLAIGFDRPPVTLVVVRDPVERFASLHALTVGFPRSIRVLHEAIAGDPSWEAWEAAVRRVWPAVLRPDSQCAWLSGEPSFEAARRVILAEYDLAAVYGDPARVAAAVGRAVGITGPVDVPPVRMRAPRLPMPPDVRARLRAENREDAKLVAWIDQRFGGLLWRDR
jgi:hypothetical protein